MQQLGLRTSHQYLMWDSAVTVGPNPSPAAAGAPPAGGGAASASIAKKWSSASNRAAGAGRPRPSIAGWERRLEEGPGTTKMVTVRSWKKALR